MSEICWQQVVTRLYYADDHEAGVLSSARMECQ